MQGKDDIIYIERILRGDANAYTHLVNKYKGMAFTLAMRLLSVPEDAEEIAQDAFVKAYLSLKDFKGQSKFSTWLYTIVYRLSISKLRKNHIKTISIDDKQIRTFDVEDEDHFLANFTEKEQQELLENALKKLSGEEQALITLYYLDENSIKEISGITGDTESNVKVKLYRVRKKLELLLTKDQHKNIPIGHE